MQKCTYHFSKLLMLASDGPNVNRKVFRLMNENQGQEKSVQRTNRYWHMQSVIVYDAFGKAFEEFGADTINLIVTVFAFFGWTLRWEKRESVGLYKSTIASFSEAYPH